MKIENFADIHTALLWHGPFDEVDVRSGPVQVARRLTSEWLRPPEPSESHGDMRLSYSVEIRQGGVILARRTESQIWSAPVNAAPEGH